jgi:peroxiredoxin
MASTDPVETNAKFAAEHGGGGFPILSDTDKKVGLAYGVIDPTAPPERQRARRWTFYIGPTGRSCTSTRSRAFGPPARTRSRSSKS